MTGDMDESVWLYRLAAEAAVNGRDNPRHLGAMRPPRTRWPASGRRRAVQPVSEECPARRAIVWFADGPLEGPWWLRLLQPGYRHCGVLIEAPRYDVVSGHEIWVAVNPRIGGTEIDLWIADDVDELVAEIEDPRFDVTRTIVTRAAPPAPGRPYSWFACTCVEQVKRVLGIRGWWIWTPWQLYRRIANAG